MSEIIEELPLSSALRRIVCQSLADNDQQNIQNEGARQLIADEIELNYTKYLIKRARKLGPRKRFVTLDAVPGSADSVGGRPTPAGSIIYALENEADQCENLRDR